MKKTVIQCYTTPSVLDKARQMARAQGRTLSNLVQKLIVEAHDREFPRRNLLGE